MKSLVLRHGMLFLLPALSACMNMSGLGGDSKYACKAPEGVACESVSGTYANAVHNNLPSQRAQRSAVTEKGESEPRPSTNAVRTTVSTASGNADDGTTTGPLRSQARVLRLWIKPWEDADGDLYDQGYIYVQVDNGQWLIDHVQRQIRDAYAPVKPPPSTTTATDTSSEPPPAANTPIAPMAPQRPPFSGSGINRAQ